MTLQGRTALIAGATGLVGSELLSALLDDARYSTVLTIGRRLLEASHPKLQQLVVDFAAIPDLAAIDDVFIALGTTRKVAGSEAAMRAVDVDAVVASATRAQKAGARRLGVVSSMGANSQSAMFYPRIKGEMEAAVIELGFEQTVIARPSQLCGTRELLGQPKRVGELLAIGVMGWLGPLIPASYRVIPARSVALSLMEAVALDKPGLSYLQSADMQRNAK
jgi:uncharacterized protein YbjT (DUF2867 family)